jgi:diphthamide synthase (EF-2-diphthine--ammonia ligase)
MQEALDLARNDGITHVVFGDLFLEDIRAYRERQLARVGMSGVFPLWRRETSSLAREMVSSGLKAHVVCVDPRRMPTALAGRAFDESLLRDFSADIDPCGENGEFHTFAWDGPMFSRPVAVTVGETVERDGFVFTDLITADVVHG